MRNTSKARERDFHSQPGYCLYSKSDRQVRPACGRSGAAAATFYLAAAGAHGMDPPLARTGLSAGGSWRRKYINIMGYGEMS